MILFLFLIKQTTYFHRSLYFARNLMQFKGFEEHDAITSMLHLRLETFHIYIVKLL